MSVYSCCTCPPLRCPNRAFIFKDKVELEIRVGAQKERQIWSKTNLRNCMPNSTMTRCEPFQHVWRLFVTCKILVVPTFQIPFRTQRHGSSVRRCCFVLLLCIQNRRRITFRCSRFCSIPTTNATALAYPLSTAPQTSPRSTCVWCRNPAATLTEAGCCRRPTMCVMQSCINTVTM
jgi:hypothetical protein